ncbi:replication endonuclease [Escherichia coli]|uniref:Replication endonuclease n=1 Tax=Escherichia coli TaxID=562 RepID=A0A895NNW4_ECOLX|nr:replication endonuclease [Escherichia coli]EFO3082776.1 replication endonuclease [Escherichia coli O9]EIV7912632.1 replication endonuclease [Klebsiella pneumoniae]EFO3532992.1 replication endonuclease [Escherichia coli]EFO4843977.1 replication endonuclease [Escherichia coli]EGX8519552.1 replication endonuclease [Escherichia coli]
MTAEYIRDWQQPRHAVGREGTGIPVPESALSSWLDAYRAENERRQEMADAAFSATPLGNLINKSLDAQEKQDKTITLAGDARKQARGAVDEAMASLRLLPSYLRDPLIRHLSFLRKKQEADRRKGKKSWQAERYARGTLRKIFERLDRTDHRWLTPGYRSLAGRERLDDLLYLPQLNQYQIQTLATMTAAMFSSTFEKLCDGFGATDGELTMDVTLKAYQMLARMALHLHAMPPHYEALNKSDPDTELLPGAILRLTCAEWWKRKLWLLRCEWREEQLRAACLVSRKTSPYLSQDALSEFRAQREKTRDFLKSFMLENEDGFTIDLETVYYAGVSNPVHRKAEMMATMKGLELLAEARGDRAVFLTVTCPSKYHATTENGHPNPKWNGATMRDSSDYLVNTFFAAVRKKLNRDGLRWYGIRTVEPHHDGTVHWHMMVFAHPEEIDTIVSHTRDIAIQEDRHELGDDITPRFKAEYVDGSKGTPTSYIATYIGKNLDSHAVDGIDPKTGKPRVDHETGKSMAESVERAIGWARLHRVRQFQFFGIPSRQVWRELRRLASQMARNPEGPQRLKDDAMDAVLAAADAGCFASYIEKQGGVLVPRKDYLIRTAYDLADELNDYGEQSVQIYGIWSPLIGESSRVCTHPDNWKLVRRKPEAEDSARENGFDLQGGPAAPWTRGNNCPRVQETDNNGTEQPEERPAPWPQLPEGVDVNEWMRSLKRHERRALMRSLRDKQAKNSSDEMQNWTQSRKQPQPLPDNHELLAKEWRESAESLGLHIGEQQMQHLLRGGSLYVGGSIITPQGFEIVRKPDTRPDSRITQLWQRLSRNHGVSSTEIRHNPVASYLEQLEASDPEAAARLASTLQQDQNTMKTPVTVLSDMLRAIRDAEHAQRINETTKHARKKISLLHRTR